MTRRIEVLILPLVLLASIALPVPLLAGDLPDPLATHWSFDGTPDGSMGRTVFWLGATAAWLALWAVLAGQARKRGRGPLPEAVLILGVGGFLAGLLWVTVLANHGAATWREAGEVGFLAVLPAIALGLLLAGVAWLLERGRTFDTAPAEPGPATIGLAGGEHAVWVGQATSRGMAVGGLALALVMGAAGVLFAPPLIAAAFVVAIAVAWVSTVRVTASARGLRIAFGPFGVPAKQMPLEQIERAEAGEIEPLQWGGWGYRWAGRGRSAVVVRRGPGLVLELRGGRRFAVTVDDPAPAAGLLNDLGRRRARRPDALS